jgi:Flp pilus assembly protein TadG
MTMPRFSLNALIGRLRRDAQGAMMVETALVAPMLILMSIGSFEASQMFARESELQTAASEASAIALASKPDTQAKRNTLRDIIKTSTGLSNSGVTVTDQYRCGTSTDYVATNTGCGTLTVSNFVKIYITDTYTPGWTQVGIGGPVTYRVTRYVMLNQS